MIARSDLLRIAQARLKDAQALLESKRYDGAAYLCGYAIELKLKARICKTLRWPTFPSSRREFEDLVSFRTHDLGVLLQLSGIEEKVKSTLTAEWTAIANWEPQMRYNVIGSV